MSVEFGMKKQLRHTISYARFTELRNLAKNTVGTSDDIYLFELESLLEIYKTINNKIQDIEDKIKKRSFQVALMVVMGGALVALYIAAYIVQIPFMIAAAAIMPVDRSTAEPAGALPG